MWTSCKRYILKLLNVIFNDEEVYVLSLAYACNRIKASSIGSFVYPFDSRFRRRHPSGKLIICSNTVDYERVMDSDIDELRKTIDKANSFRYRWMYRILLSCIEHVYHKSAIDLPYNLLYETPRSLHDAIQKILFYNALFWQADHWHVGLGRLDKVLYPYYRNDIDRGFLTYGEAKQLLIDMLGILNRDIEAKSGVVIGDTGQYILVGGIDDENTNVDNELTYLFLEIFRDYNKPDPKLIIRVNANTSDELWQQIIKTVCAGNGSPLIMNESEVMNRMIEFGYDEDDVKDVGTSACWEPLIIGKSFDQNNSLPSIVALEALDNILNSGKSFLSFDAVLSSFLDELKVIIKREACDISFDCSPLYSLFFEDCLNRHLDYSNGGAKYSYHGLQVVSLPNTVNALLNIRTFVFEKQLVALDTCIDAIKNNFNNHKDLRYLFKSNSLKYGVPDKDVLDLTNTIMEFVSKCVEEIRINGNKVKVGFSSPNYVSQSKKFPASLDGRLAGEPFAVHISPVSSSVGFPEIVRFATMLDYSGNRINGNVVDFILPTSYVDNQDKLMHIVKDACSRGLFELQLNILDLDTLIKAKENPELYPNLIVRVWGFSAFYKDLPDEYKDVLIERARAYAS